MKIKNTQIIDTFAEAFRMVYARIGITAHDPVWLQAAIDSFTGYGTSVIGCDAEVGVERRLDATMTPDGRCGVVCLVFGFSVEALGQAIVNRVGQCLMTCPSTMVFDGEMVLIRETAGASIEGAVTEEAPRVPLGKQLRFFGDGFQKSKIIGN